MKTILSPLVCLVALLSVSAESPARAVNTATALTFDELPSTSPGNGWAPISDGHGGLHWNNFGVLNGVNRPVTEGYHTGTVSPENVAFNLSGQPASISRDTGFTLHSAYLTGAFAAMHVRVQGLVGTTVTYDNTYTVSNTAPALIHFSYVGVDRVIFVSSPDSPFVMDNLTVTVPPPDAACTFVLSPGSGRHGFGSETGTVSVATQAGCTWSVANSNTWVTILSSLNNSGSGTVTYAVAADPTAVGRSGFIKIAGQKFAVSQSAPPTDGTELLTFDDLLPGLIPNGYGGLQWNNFGVLDGSIQGVTSGYRTGVVSPDNVAFNQFGAPVSISSATPFDLRSAYLTAAINVPSFIIQIEVRGFLGTTQTYTKTYTVSNNAPTLIQFDYLGVDQVSFVPSQHSTVFAMDNLIVAVPVDSDGDGVLDPEDRCPGTAPGSAVDERGCSIEQLVPCDGPITGGKWRNHGQYLRAVTAVADAFLEAGLVTVEERNAILRAARRSDCGKN